MSFDYKGANTLDLVLDWLSLPLTRRRVSSLYTQVDTRRLTESRTAHTPWPAQFLTSHALQGKSSCGGSQAQVLGFHQACLHEPMSSHLGHPWTFFILNRQRCNPDPPGRVTPRSYIPNIRPQVDLNFFMSIFTASVGESSPQSLVLKKYCYPP